MLLKILLFAVGVLGLQAERALYPAAGWRPSVPFNLTRTGYSVEISKARVEQVEQAPNGNYLPAEEQQQQQPLPANEYGAPQADSFRIVYPHEEDTSNSADLQSDTKAGRYYIVSPDNKLQRVIYRTVQDAKDITGEGFTAQLRYSTVGELQDPVYKYNQQGQRFEVKAVNKRFCKHVFKTVK
ncbi:uncharacterized protein LOC108595868 [Drosophila busckii]|uniref:uncharacterized protein LOC108595868 n=1 Tax=Drosophila busckii TaxID=30019 RepID=UPI00083F3C15|nr:uncharacterized protein LOC108595868 [Drosophila busckii]